MSNYILSTSVPRKQPFYVRMVSLDFDNCYICQVIGKKWYDDEQLEIVARAPNYKFKRTQYFINGKELVSYKKKGSTLIISGKDVFKDPVTSLWKPLFEEIAED